jgi:hypothetical protein
MVLSGILVFGLANPLPWILNRPAVYEAAISAGQFFYLVSLLASFLGLRAKRVSLPLLAIAGLGAALAVASRTNLALAVFVLTAMVSLALIKRWKNQQAKLLSGLASFLTPLFIGIFSIGFYNYIRFGSFLETGHRYQLGRWDKLRLYDQVISLRNIPPNLYNYLFNHPKLLDVFPFIKPRWGEYFVWPIRYYAPEYYHTEQVTGLLFAIPFILFAITPLYFVIKQGWDAMIGIKVEKKNPLRPVDGTSFTWMATTLILLIAALLFPLAVFVSASMRHELDLAPTVTLLAWIGFVQGYQAIKLIKKQTFVYSTIGLVLIFTSSIIGILLAITGYQARFEALNPELFEYLTRFFAW